ncbi:MAG: outer membrane protein transport protein [Nitrospirota bacterium]
MAARQSAPRLRAREPARPRRDRLAGPASGWGPAILIAVLVTLLTSAPARATNGLNLIGSGGISSDLAGADTAVATDFSAMNTNPAGMTQVKTQHAGLSVTMLQPQLRLRNSSTNREGENDPLIIPNAGYIRHIADTPVTVGIGFFTVGGTASDFRDVRTALGTTDKTSSQIRHYKLTPSIAYQVTDKLSLGVALAISYSDVSLAVLPNTPTGFETTGKCDRMNGVAPPGSCAYAFALTPKFGAMYQMNEMVTLGLAYTMAAPLPFSRGQITRNQVGIGKVTYDADVNGFKWPADLSAGVALRPNKDLLLSFKFQWINWDAALNNVVINLKNGNNAAMPTDQIVLQYQWRDQYVTAIGASYDVTDRLNVHAGYNFGNNPVPKSTLDPTSANITVHHFAGGAWYHLAKTLRLDGNFTYALTNNVTYDSARYGNNTTLSVGGYEALVTLSYWPE